jgi:hypothetical protein
MVVLLSLLVVTLHLLLQQCESYCTRFSQVSKHSMTQSSQAYIQTYSQLIRPQQRSHHLEKSRGSELTLFADRSDSQVEDDGYSVYARNSYFDLLSRINPVNKHEPGTHSLLPVTIIYYHSPSPLTIATYYHYSLSSLTITTHPHH